VTLDRRLVVEALPSYEIGDEIGRGGWGVVLVAQHRELGRQVAIKQLPRAFAADPTVRLRFKEEARLIASLDHPHIVPVYDFVEREGLCLIVMELMSGGTLWDRFVETGLPVDQACGQMLAASAALNAAHGRGILHRDVKPENFLFTSTGVMKLGDFGIAKLLDDSIAGHTLSGQIIGTPAYMSPEQASGEPIGPYTDVYSCAVMLYELLTGSLPFEETTEPLVQLMKRITEPPQPIEVARPDIPRSIAQAVMQGLARDPAERFPTSDAFGEALARAATIAFGPGWLLRSGIEVLGAPGLVAVTATPVTGSGEGMPIAKATIRPHTMHVRLGDAPDTDGSLPPSPPPFAPSVTPPAPAWTDPAATNALSVPPAPPLPPVPAPEPGSPPPPPPSPGPGAPYEPAPVAASYPPVPAPAPPPVPAPDAFGLGADPHAPTVGPRHPTPVGAPAPAPTPPPVSPLLAAPATGGGRRGRVGLLVALGVVLLAVIVGGLLLARSRSSSGNGNGGGGNEFTSTTPSITNAQPGTSANSFVVTWSDAGDPSGTHSLYAFGEHFENATAATASPTTAQLPASGGVCFVLVRGAGVDRSAPKCLNGGDPSLVNLDALKS
jgi:serine/threonine-protein kinase